MFKIPVGSLSAFKDGIISGQLPNKFVAGCVRNTAYNGVYNDNPFNFAKVHKPPTKTFHPGFSFLSCLVTSYRL